MAHINLLPWRETLRKEKQRQFLSLLALTAVAGLAAVAAAHIYFTGLLDNQQYRNSTLQREIANVDTKIKEIKELENTKQALLDRMEIIQQLQRSRPEIVHIFDEMVTTLPNGLYLTELIQKENSLKIKGMAESDARVSNYMRNLEASPWLASPKLSVIQSRPRKENNSDTINVRNFSLEVSKETNVQEVGS